MIQSRSPRIQTHGGCRLLMAWEDISDAKIMTFEQENPVFLEAKLKKIYSDTCITIITN